jgi:hypothetical protein
MTGNKKMIKFTTILLSLIVLASNSFTTSIRADSKHFRSQVKHAQSLENQPDENLEVGDFMDDTLTTASNDGNKEEKIEEEVMGPVPKEVVDPAIEVVTESPPSSTTDGQFDFKIDLKECLDSWHGFYKEVLDKFNPTHLLQASEFKIKCAKFNDVVSDSGFYCKTLIRDFKNTMNEASWHMMTFNLNESKIDLKRAAQLKKVLP